MDQLVSAIVPFYNVEEFLDDALTSIARQTYPHFECILVDDGSPDGSASIAQRWVAKDSRFRIITQENQGLGAARNTGTADARGEYLIFLDSDDLLAPRAFEQFVTSLEESGSDFAAAHIWRLPLTRPIEPSWAHSEPFAQRRQRTSIQEVPLLMRDRMAWNKMWRRSFWESGNYSWPEMKFEDFPVTMRAHLEANAVDTLPDPVYVWRERPVGQSISGQGKALDNVRDRVHAASMVLDTVDALATPEVRELVHSHLVDVDLREVMNSLVMGHSDDQPAIEALAHELGQRIDPALVSLAQPDLRQAFRAARENEMATLRSLAERRTASAPANSRTPVDRARKAPAALGRRVGSTSSKVLAKVSPRRQRTGRLIDYRIDELNVTYRVEIPLDARVKKHAVVTAALGGVGLNVESAVTPRGLLCDFTTDTSAVVVKGGFQELTFDVSAAGMHFRGSVTADVSLLHGVHRAGYWLQALNRSGRFGVERQRDAALVEVVRRDGSDVVLKTSAKYGELVVEQPWPSSGVSTPIHEHEVRLPLRDIVEADPADNPVTDVASRRLQLRTATGMEDLRLIGPGSRQETAGREVEIKRSEDGSAFLVHRPL